MSSVFEISISESVLVLSSGAILLCLQENALTSYGVLHSLSLPSLSDDGISFRFVLSLIDINLC